MSNEKSQRQKELDNRANQLNPNNEKYYKSRGYEKMKPKKKKPIQLPPGTFRGYIKPITLNSPRLNMSFRFRFEITQGDYGYYTIWVLEAPFKDYAISLPHDFHIYSDSRVCWDQNITSFQDANAIMIVWAKRYVKQLEILKYNIGGTTNGVDKARKRYNVPEGTFRIIVRIHQNVYEQIRRTIGCKTPETGGMLGCSNSLGIIDKFVFDEHAKVGGTEYNPNVKYLEKIINDKWEPGTELIGFIHSHPYGITSPSYADVEYAQNIMDANEEDSLFIPIVMSSANKKRKFEIFGYIIDQSGTINKCNIEIVSDKDYNRLIKEQVNDIEVVEDLSELKGSLSEEEIMAAFDNMTIAAESNKTEAQTSSKPLDKEKFEQKEEHIFSRIEQALPIEYLSECTIIGIGCGGAREYYLDMARMGIGMFYLMDGDKVSVSNIASQNAYKDEIGHSKVKCIKEKILNINPKCKVEIFDTMLDDNITDLFIEEKILNRIDKNKLLLCGFTDSFLAQARINNISVKYNIPVITGQHHQYGITSEIIYYYPGISFHKPQDVLSERYEAYKNGYTNKVTSEGSPIFNSTRINSLCEKISIGILLYQFDKNNIYASFLTRRPDCNLVILRQSILPQSSNFYDLFEENETDVSLFDDVAWMNAECDDLQYEIEDTRKIF